MIAPAGRDSPYESIVGELERVELAARERRLSAETEAERVRAAATSAVADIESASGEVTAGSPSSGGTRPRRRRRASVERELRRATNRHPTRRRQPCRGRSPWRPSRRACGVIRHAGPMRRVDIIAPRTSAARSCSVHARRRPPATSSRSRGRWLRHRATGLPRPGRCGRPRWRGHAAHAELTEPGSTRGTDPLVDELWSRTRRPDGSRRRPGRRGD
jgi:hypothetical protein